MEQLGQYLLAANAITHDQLKEALECQVVYGGRVGSILVDLGYLAIPALERHLSDRTGIRIAPQEWIDARDPSAINFLPRNIVAQYRVLPLKVDERTLHLAMFDPHNPAQLDEIRFATGRRVEPYVLSAERIDELLESVYGIKRSRRSIDLTSWSERDTAIPTPDETRRTGLEKMGFAPLAVGEELTTEEDHAVDVAGVPLSTPPPESTPRIDPLELDTGALEPIAPPEFISEQTSIEDIPDTPGIELNEPPERLEPGRGYGPLAPPLSDDAAAALDTAFDNPRERDEIIIAALRLARRHGRASAFFTVREGIVQGYRGAGPGLDGRMLNTILVPLETASVLNQAVVNGAPWVGVSGDDAISQAIFGALRKAPASYAALCPIRYGNNVVALLYVDRGDNGKFADTDIAALKRLTERVSDGYESLVNDALTKI